ncbi:hypothetical protein EYF80_052847 [Liparis tanakae]|uniref:Uncharacterized protein n=1 Tax=Liparis tanakae TaxID=230148 RepID=A0A4Z2F856_9TELE|nr:hypothetical protein EYF80_052847 [Liparis tanakae]
MESFSTEMTNMEEAELVYEIIYSCRKSPRDTESLRSQWNIILRLSPFTWPTPCGHSEMTDGGVVPPEAGEADLLRQDEVHAAARLLRARLLLAARGAGSAQQALPLLPEQLAVLGVGSPRRAAPEEHDARGAQDHRAGEQRQHAEADELAVGGEDAGRARRVPQGDLQQVSVGRPEELVEAVGGEGVVLRRQREHSAVRGPGADLPQGARGTREPFVAGAPEGAVGPADARPPGRPAQGEGAAAPQVEPEKPSGQAQVKAAPRAVQLPPLRHGLGRQRSTASQKSPDDPGGQEQDEGPAEPSASRHVPPF